MASNEAERRRWNDAYWTSVWPRREAVTSAVTADLVERLAPRGAERILEVGSGAGVATLAIAARLDGGAVVGVDLSEDLVALARARAAQARLDNVTFVVADAQVDPVDGGPFDAVTSQFGVMFFDDAPRAFARLRALAAPGARLVFACWAPVELNPWFLGPALAPFVEPPPAPAPGASVTGPFALSDAAATTALLEGAGWSAVRCEERRVTALVERDAIFDDEYLTYLDVHVAERGAARRAVAEQLAPLALGDGRLAAPLAFLLVTAANAAP